MDPEQVPIFKGKTAWGSVIAASGGFLATFGPLLGIPQSQPLGTLVGLVGAALFGVGAAHKGAKIQAETEAAHETLKRLVGGD